MAIRLSSLLIIVVLLTNAVWAAPKITPQTIMDRADVAYYYPQARGLTDLAVDVSIEQLAKDPVIGQIGITLCYAGARHGVALDNLPTPAGNVRNNLLMMIEPLGEYVVPKMSVETFAGMQVTVQRVYRQLSGQSSTSYYQLTGTPTAENTGLKAYRVLADEAGVAHQVETEMQDGQSLTARIENTKIDGNWLIEKISTRLRGGNDVRWEITTIAYDTVDGFLLPARLEVTYRNIFNQPIAELPDLTYTFTNYRINTGAAATLLPPPAAQP